ncbi:thermonuclease family protein (plasmid) [Ochrobactrum sp. MT180101]|nr:thermonuclease family protein [Ochrobactrum sp. MT180101]
MALLLTVGLAVAEQSPGSVSGTARVFDGDTISIRQHRVRIAAIDACEKEQRGLLNGKTWPCGLVARSYLRKMIDGKHVSCRIVDVDRYNRSVGQCFIENKDIGLAMVRAGQAEAMLRYLPPNHGIDIAGYGYAENDARERLLGIWAADVESPHLYRRAHTSR